MDVAERVGALDVLAAARWEDQGADDGEPDLTAVGVAGEDEVDVWAAGVREHDVGVVGGVGHEEDRTARSIGDGEGEIGDVGSGIGGSTDGERISAAGEVDEAVSEHWDTAACEGPCDESRADGDVVISEDGEAAGAAQGGEDLGASVGGVVGGDERKRTARDEVSREQDEIGGEGVDAADDAFQKEGLGVFIEVDVADLGDAEAMETGAEVREGDRVVGLIDLMPGDRTGVDGKAGGDGAGAGEKGAAGGVGG